MKIRESSDEPPGETEAVPALAAPAVSLAKEPLTDSEPEPEPEPAPLPQVANSIQLEPEEGPQQPEAMQPELAPPPQETHSPPGLACPVCGLGFPAGVRFCDQDGTPLVDRKAAASMRLKPVVDSAPPRQVDDYLESEPWEDNEEEYGGRYGQGRSRLFPVLIAVVLTILVAGAGYAYWNGKFDNWLGKSVDPERKIRAIWRRRLPLPSPLACSVSIRPTSRIRTSH